MSTDPEIKILDYRNACYQGHTKDNIPHGMGLILTEDFLFCASLWAQGSLNGACFAVLPSQKILYGDFIDNNPEGLFCYELSKECQIYCFYKGGKLMRRFASVFPYIQCVLQIQLAQSDSIANQKQHDYQQSSQKWQIISEIFQFNMPEFIKKSHKFIKDSFLAKYSKQFEQIYGDEYYFGIKGEGIGVKMNLEQSYIKSVGYYDQNNVIMTIGKVTINKDRKVKQQGLYHKPETLIRYQERPNTNKKYYRDYFRFSINFQNSFFQLTSLEKIDKQMIKLKDIMKDGTTKRIAQQLIEHLDQYELDEARERERERERERQREKDKDKANRSRFETTSKMMNDVSLQQLKQELNRSMSHKKGKTGSSPYKQYDQQPAQLKYVTKTSKKTQPLNNSTSNPHFESQSHRSRHYESPQTRNPKYREAIKRLNLDQIPEPKNYEPIPSEHRRYPIESNLRPLHRNNTSKSPIKMEHRPFKYNYLEQDINPEGKDYIKERLYNPATNTKAEYKRADRSVSPNETRNYTPNGRNRLEKLSNMYDQMQQRNKKTVQQQNQERKYALNHGRGYQFSDEDEFDKKMGLVKTGRKVETYNPSPHRNLAPVSYNYKRQPTTEAHSYTYNRPTYDRERYNYTYNEPTDYRRQERERKTNYGYFDKNR